MIVNKLEANFPKEFGANSSFSHKYNFSLPANITKSELAGGKRSYIGQIGPLEVKVLEIPAQTISDYEWYQIGVARRSYGEMWSYDGAGKVLENNDPFDGFQHNIPCDVLHYIATVTHLSSGIEKVVTMRKVIIEENFDATRLPLPEDISFWEVRDNNTGNKRSLWEMIKIWTSQMNMPLKVATVSRTATYPFLENSIQSSSEKRLRREMSTVGFALIQLVACVDDTATLWFGQQCLEFQEKVFVFETTKSLLKLDFTSTKQTLGLETNYKVVLNNQLPQVQYLKTNFPGYWLDNEKSARILTDLVNQNLISWEMLEPLFQLVISNPANKVANNSKMEIFDRLKILTSPRNFKYLVPWFNTLGGQINTSNISRDELCELLITLGGDGPYSTALMPGKWGDSASRLLQLVELEYKQI